MATKKGDIIYVKVGTPVLYGKGQIGIANHVRVEVEQSIDRLIEKLTELRNMFASEYTDLRLRSAYECGCRSECDCGPEYFLYGYREISEIELLVKQQQEQETARIRQANEEAEYKRLKAKYGG